LNAAGDVFLQKIHERLLPLGRRELCRRGAHVPNELLIRPEGLHPR
jgi:hypothetical protein